MIVLTYQKLRLLQERSMGNLLWVKEGYATYSLNLFNILFISIFGMKSSFWPIFLLIRLVKPTL